MKYLTQKIKRGKPTIKIFKIFCLLIRDKKAEFFNMKEFSDFALNDHSFEKHEINVHNILYIKKKFFISTEKNKTVMSVNEQMLRNFMFALIIVFSKYIKNCLKKISLHF